METRELESLAAGELIERLDTSDWRVQEAAGAALVGRGEAVLAALVAGLGHPKWRVRRSCALLMDHIATDRCIAPLVAALRDPVENVRRDALHSLTCAACKPAPLHADVVGALVDRVLNDRSLRVRRIAAFALGDQPRDPRATAALRKILGEDRDPVLLARARLALERQGGDGE